jgi:AraC family transcriptional regulator of adaptative response/methylated-DNA-[protein]-cysteine methyltransferase
MHPSELRRGGAGVQMQAFTRACSLGHVLVAATSRGVCAIQLGSAPDELYAQLRERFPRAAIEASDRGHEALAERIVAMVDSAEVASDLPLDLIGTAFQRRVWRALRDIPRGATASYAEIARQVGAPQAVRAVGTACGQNPVAVAVPCHRVVRQDGSLGGYRWGLERKRALLAQERASDAR